LDTIKKIWDKYLKRINMQRSTTWIIKSLWGACERWSKSDCIDLSAAFAYYTLQSFFPILLISLSIASWFLGKQDGLDQQIISVAAQILPPSVVELVETTLFKLIDQGFGAGILGAMFLLFTAGNAYLSLQRGSDRLWEDELPSRRINSAWQEQASRFLRNRIEAFLVVFFIGFLMVLDQISANLRMIPTTVLEKISNSSNFISEFIIKLPLLQVGQFALPLVGFSLMALLLQALLPSRKVPLKPLIPGSILIGIGLTTLTLAVSKSILSLGTRFQAYGFIGGFLVLTLWVWLLGVVLYFGQCWSVVIASMSLTSRRRKN
jgi:membrane protein